MRISQVFVILSGSYTKVQSLDRDQGLHLFCLIPLSPLSSLSPWLLSALFSPSMPSSREFAQDVPYGVSAEINHPNMRLRKLMTQIPVEVKERGAKKTWNSYIRPSVLTRKALKPRECIWALQGTAGWLLLAAGAHLLLSKSVYV